MKKLFLVLMLTLFAGVLFAEEKGKEIEIPLQDIERLHTLAKEAPDNDTRIKAIQALAKSKNKASVQILVDILEEPYKNVYANGDKQMQDNWKVRAEAAKAMRAYEGDKEVVKQVYRPLNKVMVYDPEERVKGECALTLGILGRDADPDVKDKIADELIVKLNHTPVEKNLLAIMIVKALGRLGHPKALVHLIAVTQKGYLRVVKEEAKKSIEMLQNF
ncbi:MAG TPA: hypothetical protein DHW82_01085 [Spirochaetia bacterium]|nr:MAG: hypothetical protein A2Y41_02470 [Spirochaetes bacterium GWB1_36_13]HCL55592.1 hypothetical protein [Spirochaetia bacterium]